MGERDGARAIEMEKQRDRWKRWYRAGVRCLDMEREKWSEMFRYGEMERERWSEICKDGAGSIEMD